jgi:hypothetical protein
MRWNAQVCGQGCVVSGVERAAKPTVREHNRVIPVPVVALGAARGALELHTIGTPFRSRLFQRQG